MFKSWRNFASGPQLHIGERSLQRKLKEENTSFNQITEQLRQELAKEYLHDSQIEITEISFLLGFADPSTFFRAFKRWAGKTPTAYRQELGQKN